MSLPIRSERKSDIELKRTPSAVGPGSYVSHAEYSVPPSVIPFATSAQRSDIASQENVPGPGSYAAKETSNKATPSNKLGGGGPRLVPVGTGTTGYGVCTYIKNPGVGQYDLNTQGAGKLEAKRQENLRKEPKRQFSSGDLLGFSANTPAAIPIPGKHFGYDVDEKTGSLSLHPVPFITYKGTQNDCVGPGQYNSEKIPSDADKTVRFGNSNTKRSPYAEAFDPSKALGPGPAAYTLGTSMESNLKNVGGTSAFMSKTPMAHEMRPSTLDARPRPWSSASVEMSSHHHANNATLHFGPNGRPRTRRGSAKSVPFGSSSSRENTVVRHAQTPYSTPPQMHMPGPGSYKQTRKVSWLTSQLEARAQREAQRVLEEKKYARKVPRKPAVVPSEQTHKSNHQEDSSTTAMVPFEEPTGDASIPNSQMSVSAPSSELAKTRSSGDLDTIRPFTAVGFIREAVPRSVFGSTAKKTSIFEEESKRVAYQPGPGTYRPMQTELERRMQEQEELLEYETQVQEATLLQMELQIDPTPEYFMMDPIRPRLTPKIILQRRQKPTSSFMKGARRLASYSDDEESKGPLTTNPHFADTTKRAVGGHPYPELSPDASSYRKPKPGSSAVFRSTARRFSGRGSAFGFSDPEIPGPAAYSPTSSFRQSTNQQDEKKYQNFQSLRANRTGAQRQASTHQETENTIRPSSFIPKSQMATSCGPGTYSVGGSMVKKSFNVTMTNGKALLNQWETQRGNHKLHASTSSSNSSLFESIRVNEGSNISYE